MATTTQNQDTKKSAMVQPAVTRDPKMRKKISTEIVKLSDLEVGEEIEGTFLGNTDRPWLDRQTGEEKTITQALFEKADGSRFMAFLDAGAKNALSSSGVTKGDYIVLQKLEMKDLGGGRRVNQYDVFAYETNPKAKN